MSSTLVSNNHIIPKKKKKAAKHFNFKAHMLYELLLLFKLYIASFFFLFFQLV